MKDAGGGVVYWRRVAAALRKQADDACVGADRMLRADPHRSVQLYSLACRMNTAARRVEQNEFTTPDEHELVQAARAALGDQP